MSGPASQEDDRPLLSSGEKLGKREISIKLVAFFCFLGLFAITQGIVALVSGPHMIGVIFAVAGLVWAIISVISFGLGKFELSSFLKILWIICMVAIFIFALLFFAVYIMNFTNEFPDHQFPTSCRKTTNCVRFARDPLTVPPFSNDTQNNMVDDFTTLPLFNATEGRFILDDVVQWAQGSANTYHVKYRNENLIHLVFYSKFWAFADDFFVQLVHLNNDTVAANIFSESRIGVSDFGVNLERVRDYLASALDDMSPASTIASKVYFDMDLSVHPCSNFYQFSCGKWLNRTILPSDSASYWRSISNIANNNIKTNYKILTTHSINPKLTTFFRSCLDTINLNDGTGLCPFVSLIDNLNTSNFMETVGHLYLKGVTPFFSLSSKIDPGNPQKMIATFSQGGLGLPYPSLYSDSPQNHFIQAEYRNFTEGLFESLSMRCGGGGGGGGGLGGGGGGGEAALVYELEKAIAEFTLPNDQLIDPVKLYNKVSLEEFIRLSPLDWGKFFGVLNITSVVGNVTVTVPAYYSNISGVVNRFSIDHWKAYLKFRVMLTFANYLSMHWFYQMFDFFSTTLRGIRSPEERTKFCVQQTDFHLGELLGTYFMSETFPQQSIRSATDLILQTLHAMDDDITALNWMDNKTKEEALKKRQLVSYLVGGPTKPDNYSSLSISMDFFENALNSLSYRTRQGLATVGQEVDKGKWHMTASTVDAYYDPTKNQMVFPAGILQNPFFDQNFPQAMNHGGIGMVMGHEITHGFDNQGRLYTGNGLLHNWWQNETSLQFDNRAQCVINQYNNYTISNGQHINGQLTQGENIADMGGIKLTYEAFLKQAGSLSKAESIVPGLNNAQLLFVAFSQGWCTQATVEYLDLLVKTDSHSPPEFRVLGPLRNLQAFADTFGCKKGDFMYPQERCEVW